MSEDTNQDQRYRIVVSLHKIETLLKELPDTIANAVDKALNEAFDNLDKNLDKEDKDVS